MSFEEIVYGCMDAWTVGHTDGRMDRCMSTEDEQWTKCDPYVTGELTRSPPSGALYACGK